MTRLAIERDKLRTVVGGPPNMPELQEECGALGFDCLDHWLPGVNLLLRVDSGCVGVPEHRVTERSFRSFCSDELTRQEGDTKVPCAMRRKCN